jgi:hypothetical protein
VYDDEGNAIGEAVLNIYDSYNPSVIWVLLGLAFLWIQAVALLGVSVLTRKWRKVGAKS